MKNNYFFINEDWYKSIDRKNGKCKHFLDVIDQRVIDHVDALIHAAQTDWYKILYAKSIKDNYYNLVSELESKFNEIFTKMQEDSSKLNNTFKENIFADEKELKEKAKNIFDTLLQELRGYAKSTSKIDKTEEYSKRFLIILKGFKEFLVEQKEGYELIFVYSNCPQKDASRRKTLIKLIRRTFQNAIMNGNHILKDVEIYQSLEAVKDEYKELYEQYKKFALSVFNAESMFEVIKNIERKVVKNNLIVDFTRDDKDVDILDCNKEDREYWEQKSKEAFGDKPIVFRKLTMVKA